MTKTSIAALAALALAAPAAFAQEPYTSFDAFPVTEIDFTKWTFGERTRLIVGGALQLSQRDYGDQYDNTGLKRQSFPLTFDEPARVTQMKASVAMDSYLVQGCANNTTSRTRAQARVVGSFFNVGVPTPGSQLGDVIALARLTRAHDSTDPVGVVKVEAVAVQCTASDCLTNTLLGPAVVLGTATLGTYVRLMVQWNPTQNSFSFQRDTQPVQTVIYGVPDANPPGTPFKQLDTRTEIANCFSAPRGLASVAARFDSVQVNASAAP